MTNACVLLMALLSAAPAGDPSAAAPLHLIPHDDQPASEAVSKKLARTIDVNWRQVKFGKAILDLRSRTRASFTVNWAALEAAGIEPNMLVTLDAVGTPAATILRQLVRQVGDGSVGVGVIDGVVHVSTYRELAKLHDTLVYDIRFAIREKKTKKNSAGRAEFDLNAALG